MPGFHARWLTRFDYTSRHPSRSLVYSVFYQDKVSLKSEVNLSQTSGFNLTKVEICIHVHFAILKIFPLK